MEEIENKMAVGENPFNSLGNPLNLSKKFGPGVKKIRHGQVPGNNFLGLTIDIFSHLCGL